MTSTKTDSLFTVSTVCIYALMSHIRSAPRKNVVNTSLRPCVSPNRLQNPVEIALRTLIVVTTAEPGQCTGSLTIYYKTYMLEF